MSPRNYWVGEMVDFAFIAPSKSSLLRSTESSTLRFFDSGNMDRVWQREAELADVVVVVVEKKKILLTDRKG